MPKIIPMLRDDWEPIEEPEFFESLKGEERILLRIPLRSHGRTNSYLDICDELLEASYFCESLAREFACGELERKYENHSDFYLLAVTCEEPEKLASALFRLQWAFNSSSEPEFEAANSSIRAGVCEFEDGLSKIKLRYPELVDTYLANRLGGMYFECGFDSFYEEHSTYPERRFGFWKSAHFNAESTALFVSIDAWLIPPGLKKEDAFERLEYGKGLSLLNADLVVTNGTASFLSEGTVLTIPFRKLIESVACLRFTRASDDEATEMIWPSDAHFFISEFKEFAILETGGASVVLFGVSEVGADTLLRSVDSLLERHRSETYSEPMIQVDWTKFDDELFEELCYDIVYNDPRFDNSSIRKMGKSRSRDGGRDIVVMTRPRLAERPRKFIVQCKAIAPDKSLTTSNLGPISDVIDQYAADGYVVMTSGYIDATLFDRLDGIANRRRLEVIAWSRFEIERFLSRRPSLLSRYMSAIGAPAIRA